MKALVLAGGRGSNLAPFSDTRPNPMIPVAGKPVIDHTLEALRNAGVSIVNLVVGHQQEALRAHFAGKNQSEVAVNIVDQGKKPGIGPAILAARERFSPGDHFLLVYADTLTSSNIFSVTLQSFGLNNEPAASVCLTTSAEKYGNVYIGADMKITRFVEKPKKAGLGNYVLSGVFALSTTFFGYLEKNGANMEKAIMELIKKDSLRASIWEDAWLDMAYPWDILTANRMMMDRWTEASIHHGVELRHSMVRGPIKICEGARISPGAVLEGPAYIGPGAFVGHNTLIRPHTCIGAGCVVGHGAELKNCVIFPDTVVGGLSFIVDSVVGEKVDIGAGGMTINRAVGHGPIKVKIGKKNVDTGLTKLGSFIGDGAKIGAANILAPGAVVNAGALIPHNTSYPAAGGKQRK